VVLPFSGLFFAEDVAVDQAGDVFVADTNNSRVVELPAGEPPRACAADLRGMASAQLAAVGSVALIAQQHPSRDRQAADRPAMQQSCVSGNWPRPTVRLRAACGASGCRAYAVPLDQTTVFGDASQSAGFVRRLVRSRRGPIAGSAKRIERGAT
jgi:hypothetical protein